jgi:hypothetical protein
MKVWIGVLSLCGLVGMGCGEEDTDDGDEVRGTYEDVSEIFGGPEQEGIGSCAAGSCHGMSGIRARAELNFKEEPDLTAVLVNVQACENPAMVRVKPGEPDASWLWVKLTAPITDTTTGLIDYAGEPATDCSGVTNGFGTRMPFQAPFTGLPEEKLHLIKTWIEDGAKGPN